MKPPDLISRRNKPAPATHDYTDRHWGHDYVIINVHGNTIKMMGWGHGIQTGDYILIVSQDKTPGVNPDTRYQIKSVEYRSDPRDMWSCEAEFAPRPGTVPPLA